MKTNLRLFKMYTLASALTFSGGMAMLPVIEKEACEKYNLIDKETLHDYTTLSQTFPGVIAVTNACLVGKKINGTSGMLAAAAGTIFPTYLLMSLATILYRLIPTEGAFLSALSAVRATSAAFLFAVAYTIAHFNLKSAFSIGFALFSFAVTLLNLISAPILILTALLIGFFIAYRRKEMNHA